MKISLKKIGKNHWQIEKQPGMKVEAVVFAKEEMLIQVQSDLSLVQLAQAASLPSLVSPVVGLPDIHQGFGLPIGGVMASQNLVSSGAVGMDINCGVRLLAGNLKYNPQRFNRTLLMKIMAEIEKNVPAGLGRRQKKNESEKFSFEEVIVTGVQALVKVNLASQKDADHCEENGQMKGAKLESLSPKAIQRARKQLGTLGSGNHFIEIQVLDEVFEPELAKAFGLFKNQIGVMIHCGSRALGHQTCLDYTQKFAHSADKYGFRCPNRNLASLPADSPEGKNYLSAMAGAVNFAFANRQLITHKIRQVFSHFFSSKEADLNLVYDVAHNIAKWESYRNKKVLVHRKGATRALPANHPQNPKIFQKTGHPAIVPGSMGTNSYVLVGLPAAEKSYFSVNHGAGRIMSRQEARKKIKQTEFEEKMKNIVHNKSFRSIADESPQAYKDIDLVTETIVEAGLAKKVARFRPLAVIKGD